jgi:hypothetical protein
VANVDLVHRRRKRDVADVRLNSLAPPLFDSQYFMHLTDVDRSPSA